MFAWRWEDTRLMQFSHLVGLYCKRPPPLLSAPIPNHVDCCRSLLLHGGKNLIDLHWMKHLSLTVSRVQSEKCLNSSAEISYEVCRIPTNRERVLSWVKRWIFYHWLTSLGKVHYAVTGIFTRIHMCMRNALAFSIVLKATKAGNMLYIILWKESVARCVFPW